MLRQFFRWSLIGCILGLASLSGTALAIPALQLDIVDVNKNLDNMGNLVGGHYRGGGEETTFSSSDTFMLFALWNCDSTSCKAQDTTLSLTGTFVIVASLVEVGGGMTQKVPNSLNLATLGSFDFNGSTYNLSTMTHGTPPNLPGTGGHGIFDTYYTEFSFMFDADVHSNPYDVAEDVPMDDHPGPAGHPGSGMYYVKFNIDVSNIMNGPNGEIYDLHFDLYGIGQKCTGGGPRGPTCSTEYVAAPFSHDAQGYRTDAPNNSVPEVPEPSTLLLLGSGLAGLGLWRKRKRSRHV